MSGIELMADLLATASSDGRIHGVVVGVVTNNQDPDKLGRVKLKFPWLSDTHESNWARVVSPMAGNGRGLYLLPEVEDEVLVVFGHGRMDHPYVLGALWNGKDKPPADNGDGKNNLRVLKSRSGHTITLDDTSDAEKISIVDKSGESKIELDVKAKSVSVTSAGALLLKAAGDITIDGAGGAVTIKAKTLLIDAAQTYEIKAGEGAIKATTALKIDCAAGVNVNSGALEVK